MYLKFQKELVPRRLVPHVCIWFLEIKVRLALNANT